jgi:hypothetical protein
MADILAALFFALWIAATFLAAIFARRFQTYDQKKTRHETQQATDADVTRPDRDAKTARGLLV